MSVNIGPCFRCKTNIYIPEELRAAARASSKISFWCPYGHEQIFAEGETEAQKLRRERDLLQQRIAQRDDEIAAERTRREATERQLSAQRGVVTRIKNRVGHGVCPCCNRSFQQLQRHMNSKHPDWAPENETAA